MHFMRQILRGDKLWLRQDQVVLVGVPLWQELGIDRIWPRAMLVEDLRRFLPDEWASPKKVERDFFWGVLTTIRPQWTRDQIDAGRVARQERRQTAAATPMFQIEVTRQWGSELLRAPYQSGKFPDGSLTFFSSLYRLEQHEQDLVREPAAAAATG